ncbi:hypothetical protein [Nocardia sp. SC052]
MLVETLRRQLPAADNRTGSLLFAAWAVATVTAVAPQRLREQLLTRGPVT